MPPFDAVIVVLPQKVPAPLAMTSAGITLTVKVAVLLSVVDMLHPAAFVKEVIVARVEPELARSDEGIVSVPVLVPMLSVAVWPITEFAPLRLYVASKAELPRVVELTVMIYPEPRQENAPEDKVKLLMLGVGVTVMVIAPDVAFGEVIQLLLAMLQVIALPLARVVLV